jgi:hypothetical protein
MAETPSLPLTGGCPCGAVRFEVAEPLTDAVYCHCTRCQRRTGTAAAISGMVRPGTFRLTAGEGEVRSWDPGDGLAKAFCGACGGALFAAHPKSGDVLAVRFGALDGEPGVRPSARQFTAYAASWESIPDDGLPRFPERRPPAAPPPS